jgi:hypothetical protein
MLTVSFVMRLRRVLRMILGMQFVTVRDMGVMRCFLVVPVLMMPCGLMMMFCSMFVVFCCFFMMVDQL